MGSIWVGSLLLASVAPADTGGVNLGNLLGPILSTGVVGVVLLMLLFEVGFITKKSHEREVSALESSHQAELKAREDQIETLKNDVSDLKIANGTLATLVQEKMIPAIVQSTEVGKAYVAELARRNEHDENERWRRGRGRRDGDPST